ncbi:SPOR domain-containing protein [Sphingomonas sp.]|uniref:SPOR domain-containing protein n=1 Tax=Sphingomonas sp. TaxID=28214 RepID=UPI00286A3F29|nr:SPOR domain-containing protein [Sphingomonas sp.]
MPNHRARAARTIFVLAVLSAPALPAAAQYSPYAAAATPADPGAALAGALRTLATQPKDLAALMAAGRASLEMGDMQAAAGFFGRAEEYYPSSPAAKVGVGAAMTMMGDAIGAMAVFDRAQTLGAPQSMLALDRGLAFDLLGQQSRAQADYRAAMFGPQADEARRRLALSLAISKDIKGAAATIEPLLARRDAAAVRTNAFVLALAGDREGARRTIDAALPGAGARFEPFFRLLPVLRADEKAMAVHLGEFPKDAAQRYARAQPISSSPVLSIGNRAEVQIEPRQARNQIQVTPPKNAKAKPPVVQVATTEAPRRAVREAPKPSTYFAMSRPSLDPSRYASKRRKPDTAAVSLKPAAKEADPEPRPGFKPDELAPVAEIEEPLVPVNAGPLLNPEGEPIVTGEVAPIVIREAALEPPPRPLPKLEIKRPPPSKPKVELVKVKKPVEPPKTKEVVKKEPASLLYVQLASGAHAARMGTEFARIKAKKPGLFAGRNARVTRGKDLFRLVIGPFKTKSDSSEFVNQLSKAGIDGFSYTAPDGMMFDKIPAK